MLLDMLNVCTPQKERFSFPFLFLRGPLEEPPPSPATQHLGTQALGPEWNRRHTGPSGAIFTALTYPGLHFQKPQGAADSSSVAGASWSKSEINKMGQQFEPQGFSSFYNAGVQLRKLMFSHQRSVPATDQVELLLAPYSSHIQPCSQPWPAVLPYVPCQSIMLP